MKEKFKSFYQLSEDELKAIWSDKDTIFVFDTNILLNLYQYSQETRDEFFKVLEAIESRIWIPFHVGLEYQRRRLDIVKDEKSVFIKINKKLEDITGIVEKDFSDFNLKDRNPVLFEMKEKFKKDICDLVESFKESVKTQDDAQPSVRSEDEVRARLDKLFIDKVGEEPNEEFLKKIYEEGEDRYEKKIPPGYKDSNKEKNPEEANFVFNGIGYKRKFGDLIIWKQIVSYSRDSDTLKNVVFITDDSKEDWWELIESRGKKVIGARPELKNEIYKEAGIKNFKMYHTNDFLTDAEKYYDVSIDENAIDEATEFLSHSIHTSSDIPDDNLAESNLRQRIFDQFHANQSVWDKLNVNRSALDQLKADQSVLDQLKANQSVWDQIKASQSVWDKLNVNRSALDQFKADQSVLDQLKANQSVWDKLKANQSVWEQLNSSRSALDQLNIDQDDPDRNKNDDEDI